MESGKIGDSVVDALQNVDLAIVRPWSSTKSPEGRPGTADTVRHMFEIGDPQALCVRIFSFYTDTRSPIVVVVVTIRIAGRTIVRVGC